MTRVLIAGMSTRAAAESAARAGFAVTAIDAFADLDRHPSVRALAMPRDFGRSFSAPAAARAGRDIKCDAVVYLSNFENHPGAVSTLAAGRALWGNTPEVLLHVRDPRSVADAYRRRGIPAPAVRVSANEPNAPNVPNAPGGWLVKPLSSGGGYRIRPWRPVQGRPADEHGGGRVPRGCYLQEHIEGVPGSVVFVAAGGHAVPVGVSRQLIGDPAFGAHRYHYCGSILAAAGDVQFTGDEALLDAATALASAAAEDFNLIGVNGIDFMARDGVLHPIEVNPRWCGSMELVERAYGFSVFGAHAAACTDAVLPEFSLARARRDRDAVGEVVGEAVGKAVVFARQDVVVRDTRSWLADGDVRDVPHPGDRIAAGRPVCTVFAAGPDAESCYAALVKRAGRVYAELAAWSAAVPM